MRILLNEKKKKKRIEEKSRSFLVIRGRRLTPNVNSASRTHVKFRGQRRERPTPRPFQSRLTSIAGYATDGPTGTPRGFTIVILIGQYDRRAICNRSAALRLSTTWTLLSLSFSFLFLFSSFSFLVVFLFFSFSLSFSFSLDYFLALLSIMNSTRREASIIDDRSLFLNFTKHYT